MSRGDVAVGAGAGLVGAGIGAAAVIASGVLAAYGSSYAAFPAFVQQSGTQCLQYQEWVLDRSAEGLTEGEIVSLTLIAVEAATVERPTSSAGVPSTGASTSVQDNPDEVPGAAVQTEEQQFFVVCGKRTPADVRDLVARILDATA